MSERPPAHALEEVAQKWRALAERRCAYFVELYRSGRWRHYYSEEQFLVRLREGPVFDLISAPSRPTIVALGKCP